MANNRAAANRNRRRNFVRSAATSGISGKPDPLYRYPVAPHAAASRLPFPRWNEKAGLPGGCVKLPMETRVGGAEESMATPCSVKTVGGAAKNFGGNFIRRCQIRIEHDLLAANDMNQALHRTGRGRHSAGQGAGLHHVAGCNRFAPGSQPGKNHFPAFAFAAQDKGFSHVVSCRAETKFSEQMSEGSELGGCCHQAIAGQSVEILFNRIGRFS
jgi:hypothetical protein